MIQVTTPFRGKFIVKDPKKIKWWKTLASHSYHAGIKIKEMKIV